MVDSHPLQSTIDAFGVAILDGGLATELEADGYDLRHPLWSAKLLIDNQAAIRRVHERYLTAGADCITAATYQATVQGLKAVGIGEEAAVQLFQRAIDLAVDARTATGVGAVIAASVGPYGAYLADGSEYDGRYGLSRAELRGFHAPRWEILKASGADLFACETIPSLTEVAALADLCESDRLWKGWISVACRDGQHLNDGTPIEEVVPVVQSVDAMFGLGINCSAPEDVGSLIQRIRAAGYTKVIVVYPNSGEQYVPQTKSWTGTSSAVHFRDLAQRWWALGARVIGGCCRTTPQHVQALTALRGRGLRDELGST